MPIPSYFYEPFHDPFYALSSFNRLLDNTLITRMPNSRELSGHSEDAPTVSSFLRPRMDLHESKTTDEMTAIFELPGMKKEDVSIDVHRNHLIVSGQSTITNSLDKDGYAVRERRFGKFSRSIPLPAGIKPEDVKASMEDGVLTVKFPKSHSDQEPKRVTIS